MCKHIAAFVKEKISAGRLFPIFTAFIATLAALDYFFKTYIDNSEKGAIIWAMTLALGIFSFVALLNFCIFSQLKMQDELDRVSKVKARLESVVLKNRLSSK